MSLQLEIFESGPQTAVSWSTVRQVTGFSGLTTTVSASVATWTSS